MLIMFISRVLHKIIRDVFCKQIDNIRFVHNMNHTTSYCLKHLNHSVLTLFSNSRKDLA